MDTAELLKIREMAQGVVAAIDAVIVRSEGLEGEVEVVGQSLWRKSEVADLVASVAHLKGAVTLLELCTKPNDWISYEQVHAASANADVRQTRNELSAMSRHLDKLRGTNAWPVEVQGNPLRYRSSETMARWIEEALAAMRAS